MWDKGERQRYFRQFIDFQIDSFKEKQTQCLNRPVEKLPYLYLLFHSWSRNRFNWTRCIFLFILLLFISFVNQSLNFCNTGTSCLPIIVVVCFINRWVWQMDRASCNDHKVFSYTHLLENKYYLIFESLTQILNTSYEPIIRRSCVFVCIIFLIGNSVLCTGQSVVYLLLTLYEYPFFGGICSQLAWRNRL